ncbi:hypothetical protein ASD16_03690 [Cellulomonas sp. Root485]|uniref:hypothetical protein n=1 Tax=Cellulomonas sp. Root485 TaxID=1736546 RepID=UPI0006FF6832|nr:hypothetical protein [Cellulomonas sp. Root485]KQY24631.1 hypothetical protein ASD16_03690 [Cellulomonas sp. Root485]
MDTSVMDLPAPVAARLRRPGWRDPRLLAGVAMVAASVLLGSWAVRTAQATVPVYVTRAALVPGDRVTAADLAVVDVRLGTVDLDHYLRADQPVAGDGVAVRAVGRGELVPASAVGSAADLDLRPVSVTLTRAPSSDVVPGALVDLWFTPPAPKEGTEPAEPDELAGGLTVAEVSTPSGAFGASGGSAVQVLVPSSLLPVVLTALAAEGTVDVVPVLGTGG